MKLTFKCQETMTIKEFIIKNISRNFFGYLKESNVKYYLSSKLKKSYEEIKAGEVLEIIYDEVINNEGIKSPKPLEIIYEDANYLVINKEAHLQSIPSRNKPDDSVYNRLLTYADNKFSIHLLNRLDKETKGLMLIAKSKLSAILIKDFKKVYYATTNLPFENLKGTINYGIKRLEGIKRGVDLENLNALTTYEFYEEEAGLTTYKVYLGTGKTHQIRVHFSYLGHPLINDTLYGGFKTPSLELGLACKEVSYFDPFLRKMQFFDLKS